MKRFLGIFATALLFLFLFTFFGGSYFLDIQHHFYAWMFPVSLGIAFVIWAFCYGILWTERNNHKGEFVWILTSPALPSGSCGKPNT